MDSKSLRRQNLAQLEREFDSLAEIERKTNGDVTASYLSQVKNGYRELGDRVARRLELALGQPAGWMDQKHDDVYRLPKTVNLRHVAREGAPARSASLEAVAILDDLMPVVDAIEIPRLEIRASMGAGELRPGHDAVAGTMQLSTEWIRRHLPDITSPKNLRIISGYGDSMDPTFRDGDVLIIDTGVREVHVDAVYVFALDNELYIKTIQRVPNVGLRVISDNKKYEPYVLEETTRRELDVLGRVVWAWNGRKL